MGEGGVEPPRPYGHTDLNRARLPFRHSPSGDATLARRNDQPPALHHRSRALVDRSGTRNLPYVARRALRAVREGTRRGSPADLRASPRRVGRGCLRAGLQRRGAAGRDRQRTAARSPTTERKSSLAAASWRRTPTSSSSATGTTGGSRSGPSRWAKSSLRWSRSTPPRSGYSFVGPVEVGFEHRNDIGTGVFRVRSSSAVDGAPRRQKAKRRRRRRPPAAAGPDARSRGRLPAAPATDRVDG